MHLRCAGMLDQGGAIDWDDFRFVLAATGPKAALEHRALR